MTERSIASIVRSLGRLSVRWLDRRYPFRKRAVQRLVRRSRFSAPMAETMLDATFRELTTSKLGSLLRSELGDASVLDGFRNGKRARGPENIVHVFASNIPNAAVWSLVFGMLVKSRNVARPSSRDEGIADIYLASLKAVDKDLASMNRLILGKTALDPYIKEAGLVVAYGSDQSLEEVRKRVPAATPFMGHGHRVSAAVFSREVLNDPKLSEKAAHDVWTADQRGCLSPMTFFVEKEGASFAGSLALALRRKQKDMPSRDAIASFSASQRGAVSSLKKGSFVIESSPRGLWSVGFEKGTAPAFGSNCQVAVRSFEKIEQVYASLKPLKKHLQCIALETSPKRREVIAGQLSELGVNRICRAGKMQTPPITWHHDGKFNLASWLCWTDLEK